MPHHVSSLSQEHPDTSTSSPPLWPNTWTFASWKSNINWTLPFIGRTTVINVSTLVSACSPHCYSIPPLISLHFFFFLPFLLLPLLENSYSNLSEFSLFVTPHLFTTVHTLSSNSAFKLSSGLFQVSFQPSDNHHFLDTHS